jgi:hypothetical protein
LARIGFGEIAGIVDDLHRDGGGLELVHGVGDGETGISGGNGDRAGGLAARAERGLGFGA